jgi:hypothetical protein
MLKKMMISLALISCTAGFAFAEETPEPTNDNDHGINIALGARISTLGVGPELSVGFSDYITTRVAGHWGEFSVDGDTSDVKWDTDLNLASGLATLEWNVFAGGFHIDVGVIVHDNYVDATAKPTGGTFTFNGETYTAAEAGTVSGDVDFDNSVAPYVGIGWGNPVDNDTNLTFFCNLGVVFQGSPDVSLKGTGTLANDPIFQQNLKVEEKELQDELDKFEYYPVITLGMSYKF